MATMLTPEDAEANGHDYEVAVRMLLESAEAVRELPPVWL